jgi:hypothetical protein
MGDAAWCHVCDSEWPATLTDHAGIELDSRGRPRCRVCRSADLRNGGKVVTQRQFSLALRRVLDALDVNP